MVLKKNGWENNLQRLNTMITKNWWKKNFLSLCLSDSARDRGAKLQTNKKLFGGQQSFTKQQHGYQRREFVPDENLTQSRGKGRKRGRKWTRKKKDDCRLVTNKLWTVIFVLGSTKLCRTFQKRYFKRISLKKNKQNYAATNNSKNALKMLNSNLHLLTAETLNRW